MITKQPNRQLCKNCNISLAKSNGISKHGFIKWHKYCSSCSKSIYNPKFGYRLHKNVVCDICNFKAIDKCQLDLIYLDGNKKNKNIDNIKTLCANCNRVYQKNLKYKNKSILDLTVDSDVVL